MANIRRSKLLGIILGLFLGLITIGVISATLAITISPIEFIRFASDRQRKNDLKKLSQVINEVQVKNPEIILAENKVIYVSLPDSDPTCSSWLDKGLRSLSLGYSYHCVSSDRYRDIAGNGWLPINFTKIQNAPYKRLPIDPKNGQFADGKLYYYQYFSGSYWLADFGPAESEAERRRRSEIILEEEILKVIDLVSNNLPANFINGVFGDIVVFAGGRDSLATVLVIQDGVLANQEAFIGELGKVRFDELLRIIERALDFLSGRSSASSIYKNLPPPPQPPSSSVVSAAEPPPTPEEVVPPVESEEEIIPTTSIVCEDPIFSSGDPECVPISPEESFLEEEDEVVSPPLPPPPPPNPLTIVGFQGFDYDETSIGPALNNPNEAIEVFYTEVPFITRILISNSATASHLVNNLKLLFGPCSATSSSYVTTSTNLYFYDSRQNVVNFSIPASSTVLWEVALSFKNSATDDQYCLVSEINGENIPHTATPKIILVTS